MVAKIYLLPVADDHLREIWSVSELIILAELAQPQLVILKDLITP